MLSKYTGAIEILSFVGFCAWAPTKPFSFPKTDFSGDAFGRGSLSDPGFHLELATRVSHQPFPGPSRRLGRADAGSPAGGSLLSRATGRSHFPDLVSWAARSHLLAGLARTPRVPTGYLLALFLPLFLIYLVLSFQKASQANWAAAAYVGGLILVAAKWSEAVQIYPWARWVVLSGLTLAFLETALLHETSWLHLPGRLDPIDRARGSRDLAAQISELQTSTGAPAVIANKYMTAALLSFYLPGQPDTFMPVSSPPFNQLVLWPTYREKHPLDDAIFVSDTNRVLQSMKADFPDIRSAGEIRTSQDGRQVNRFYLFICRRSSPLNQGGASQVSSP